MQLTQENSDYLKKMFATGQVVNDNLKIHFIGQKIIDFYFSYYDDEIDFDHSAFIKLSNGYYLSENNFGPVGLTNIDLTILDEEHFIQELNRLNGMEVEIRSFVETKNVC